MTKVVFSQQFLNLHLLYQSRFNIKNYCPTHILQTDENNQLKQDFPLANEVDQYCFLAVQLKQQLKIDSARAR